MDGHSNWNIGEVGAGVVSTVHSGSGVCNWEQRFSNGRHYKYWMAEIESSLDVLCPICGAQVGEVCELNTGTPRFQSHAERNWIAKDFALRRAGRELSQQVEAVENVGEVGAGV